MIIMENYEKISLYDGGNGESYVPLPEVPENYIDYDTSEDDADIQESEELPGGLEVTIKKRPPEWHDQHNISRL